MMVKIGFIEQLAPGENIMPEQFIITDEMKRAEAEAWKKRRNGIKHTVAREIRIGGATRFVNKDIVAPLLAFTRSEAADDALDVAINATSTVE